MCSLFLSPATSAGSGRAHERRGLNEETYYPGTDVPNHHTVGTSCPAADGGGGRHALEIQQSHHLPPDERVRLALVQDQRLTTHCCQCLAYLAGAATAPERLTRRCR